MNKKLLIFFLGILFLSLASATVSVTLNSPADDSTIYSNPVTFNATLNPIYEIMNISYWNNIDGWSSKFITKKELVSYNKIMYPDCSSNVNFTILGFTGCAGNWDDGISAIYSIYTNPNNTLTFNEYDSSNLEYMNFTIYADDLGLDPNDALLYYKLENGTWIKELDLGLVIGSSFTRYTYNVTKATKPQYFYDSFQFRIDVITEPGESLAINYLNLTGKLGNLSNEFIQEVTITEPTTWNVQACDSTGECSFAPSNFTVSPDITVPEITITSPTGTYDYLYPNYTLNLNWSVTDINLDKCWYNYNNINTSVNCSSNYTTFNYTAYKNNLTFYANDTLGNLASEFTSWDYKVFETNIIFDNDTVEGNLETFTLNLLKNSGTTITNVVFHYNGVIYSPSITVSGNSINASSNLIIPSVNADTNRTVYFTISLSDGTIVNSTIKTQLVRNLVLDDCSSATSRFLTLILADEETLVRINGTIRVYYQIVNPINFGEVLNFSANYSNVNQKNFCTNIPLNQTNFLLNAEIKYTRDNYSSEFYNIQRADLTTYPINISLYSLLEEDTTKFKVIYKGENLIGVEGAIIQLQRKYISEGIYRVVEAPLTSSQSTAIVHVDVNTNLYRITVVKDGVLLDTFENLAFICQSELTGECTLNLFNSIIPPTSISIETLLDLSQSINASIKDKKITYSFSVPSNTNKQVNVVAVQTDIIGEEVICNTTMISSAGSIECSYDESIDDSYIEYVVYVDGVQVVSKNYIVKDDLRDEFGGTNYWILAIFLLSLVFMAVSSPEWIVINAILVFLAGGSLWLVRGLDFVVGIGGLVWLILGAIILVMELSKQEDN